MTGGTALTLAAGGRAAHVGTSGEHAYHLAAVTLGTAAGFCTLAGLAILIDRRRTVGPVFSATTRNDKPMYAVLTLVVVLGLSATVAANLASQPRRRAWNPSAPPRRPPPR